MSDDRQAKLHRSHRVSRVDGRCNACDRGGEALAEPCAAAADLSLPHLRRFTTDGIVSEVQKRALKAMGWIQYSHAFWHLTAAGKVEAERRGYL